VLYHLSHRSRWADIIPPRPAFFPIEMGLTNSFAQAGLELQSSQSQSPHGMIVGHHFTQLLVEIGNLTNFAQTNLEPRSSLSQPLK
jgi:hypothetical protein